MSDKFKVFEIDNDSPDFSMVDNESLSSFSDEIEDSLSKEGWIQTPVKRAENEETSPGEEVKMISHTEIPDDVSYVPDVTFEEGKEHEVAEENIEISMETEINTPAEEFVAKKTSVENDSFWEETSEEIEPINNEEAETVTEEPAPEQEEQEGQETEEEVCTHEKSCENNSNDSEEVIEQPDKSVEEQRNDDEFYQYFGDMRLSGKSAPKEKSQDVFYVDYREFEYDDIRYGNVAQDDEKAPEEKKKAVIKNILSWVVTVVLAFVIALAINIFVLRPSEVSGDSMKPTLQNGDTVILSRLPYLIEAPDRGDIVVIDNRIPTNEEDKRTVLTLFTEAVQHNVITKLVGVSDPDYFWIKRIIGIPGDTISFKDNAIYRNGEQLHETYINEQNITSYPDGITVEVPEGYVYVLGDNRNHSSDSRVLGLIPEENIIGKMIGQW